jgi:hypothetical protein
MKQKDQIEKQVEETLNSLDGLTRAKANPFLFTRVEARLRHADKNTWERITSYVARPVVVLAILTMVILSNAVVMYWQLPSDEIIPEQQLALIEEYNATTTSFLEDETPEP